MGFSKWEWLVLWNPRMRRKIVFVENRKLQAFITRNFIKLELNLCIMFSNLTWKTHVSLCYLFCYLTIKGVILLLAIFDISHLISTLNRYISGLETAAASFYRLTSCTWCLLASWVFCTMVVPSSQLRISPQRPKNSTHKSLMHKDSHKKSLS